MTLKHFPFDVKRRGFMCVVQGIVYTITCLYVIEKTISTTDSISIYCAKVKDSDFPTFFLSLRNQLIECKIFFVRQRMLTFHFPFKGQLTVFLSIDGEEKNGKKCNRSLTMTTTTSTRMRKRMAQPYSHSILFVMIIIIIDDSAPSIWE